MKKNNSKQSGLSLISLTITVIVLVVITSTLIFNAKNGIKMRALNLMENDIEMLDDKINAYYVRYGALPIEIKYIGDIFFTPQANDGPDYYVIDLKALEGMTLNYGLDFNKINTEEDTLEYTDAYIINENSQNIYYAKGIQMDGVWYYTTTRSDLVPMQITSVLEIKEINEKGYQFILTTINRGEEYSYKIYINDTEDGTKRILKEGTTTESVIKTEEQETFFDIGIKDAYAEITYDYNGTEKTKETKHFSKTDMQIKYKEELEYFRNKVNSGKTYEGETIIQIEDIDLQGSASNPWTPIGSSETKTFKGTYDGKNHHIDNLYINSTLNYQGLFGYSMGNIKNLGIETGSITGGNKNAYIGALIGINDGGTIENCYNNINIKVKARETGGICGSHASGTIKQCYNSGNITVTETVAYGGVFGISGSVPLKKHTSKIIELCYNAGSITMNSNEHNTRAAGIGEATAFSTDSVAIIRNCYNKGVITNNYLGSEASSYTVSAGIAGQVENANSSVYNCYNIGNLVITANNDHNRECRRGGIAGCRVNINSSVNNCYYLETTANKEYGPGTGIGSIDRVEESKGNPINSQQLKNLATTLGTSFKEDSNNINNGYPILIWQ